MLASIIYNYGKFCDDFKSTLKLGAYITNKKARSIMVINALIGAVSTLVLFFLQAKLPLAGLNDALLGPALFLMIL